MNLNKFFQSSILSFLLLTTPWAIAQNKSAAKTGSQPAADQPVKIQFTHTAPKLEELPSPGMPLKLSVMVNKQAMNAGLKVRAVITRDGALFEQYDNDAQIGSNDHLLYSFIVPSPLVDLNYQFIFADRNGSSVSTKKYSIIRECMPNVTGPIKGNLEDPKILRVKAEQLEKEIALLEEVAKSISMIQETIDKK